MSARCSLLPARRLRPLLPVLALLPLAACGPLLTESTSTGAGVVGAGISGAVTHNAAVATGIGLGVNAAAGAALSYTERVVHHAEQAQIARAAGPLAPGEIASWSVSHTIPIEPDEHGEVVVSRVFGQPGFTCKEIVFSIEHGTGPELKRDFYTTDICRDGDRWAWASAEPATERWGGLQ